MDSKRLEIMNEHIPQKRQIILMISQSCNLNCTYCYQSNKSYGIMSIETAKKILLNEFLQLKNDKQTKYFEIAFLGGEPFLNFTLIKTISEWIWKQNIFIPYEITVRTNGTLLSKKIKKWLLKNKKKIKVGLSMDGLSDMNIFNRTSISIDWRFFCSNWPDQRIKVVLFKDSIQCLKKTVDEMNNLKIPFYVEIGEGFLWDNTEAGFFEHQLLEIVPDYILKTDEAIACGLFSFNQADFFPKYKMTEILFCGKSNNIIAYDVDGSPCICHLFSTPVQSYEVARKSWNDLRDVHSVPMDPQCISCPVQKVCKTCFGENMRLYNTIYKSAAVNTICNAVKAKSRVCAYYYLKCIESKIEKTKTLSKEERDTSAKCINLLNNIPTYIKEI